MHSRINVLVFSGTGSTVKSVQHALYTLRCILSPRYSVSTINEEVLAKEPWATNCALLVMPGGADLGYSRVLNGQRNRKITQYVRNKGAYLGFCAGGYYGCSAVEFAVGDPQLEVVGSRELKFFPSSCKGPAFAGFQYTSEHGARAAMLRVEEMTESSIQPPESFCSYYNGGGVFVGADNYRDQGIEVLARYTEPLDVDEAVTGNAAVIFARVGDGRVILSSPHPEFAGVNLDVSAGGPGYADIVKSTIKDHDKQVAFLKACLSKLGLEIAASDNEVPELTPLHLSGINEQDMASLSTKLRTLAGGDGTDAGTIVCENDTFMLTRALNTLSENSIISSTSKRDVGPTTPTSFPNYQIITKIIATHEHGFPTSIETPCFNHEAYYTSLENHRLKASLRGGQFGSHILYGEVVTSTNTLLEKNLKLMQQFPHGLTAVATTQVAGRGRGNNSWISPRGCLIFSTFLRHSLLLNEQAPVMFLQYIIAMAVVQAVRTYGEGYEAMPLKIKWPNDVYAEVTAGHTGEAIKTKYYKIAGILVNSSFTAQEFLLVVGCGLNTTNTSPTVSVNDLLERVNSVRRAKRLNELPSFEHEKLLAKILVIFEELYRRFCRWGFKALEEDYYRQWMHSNQEVRLDMEGGARARIRGITLDHGLLKAEEIGDDGTPTGKMYKLQSDGNSFDFMQGLLRSRS